MSRATLSRFLLVIAVLLGAVAAAVADDSDTKKPDPKFFTQTVRPMMEQFCFTCHTGENPEGDVKLDKYKTYESVVGDTETWELVFGELESGEMPPSDSSLPGQDQVDYVVEWLEKVLDQQEQPKKDPT